MIVKVQRPVWPPDGEVLIYNKTRSVTRTMPMTCELKTLFDGRFKIYCNADVDGDKITFNRRVQDKDW